MVDEPGALTFVASGTVVRARLLPDASPLVFDVVTAGEAFAQRRADEGWADECRAMTDVKLCVVPRDVLHDALARDPASVAPTLAVYERTGDRVAEWSTLRAVSGARERLQHTLRMLGGTRPSWASLGVLAQITGLRRETVCRALRPMPRASASGTAPSAARLHPTA